MFWILVSYLFRAILSLRYQIRIKGMENLRPNALNRKQGILFLPNHTAHVEPFFIMVWLWPQFRMRPLVIDHVFRIPLLKPWIKLVKAISVPNFETSVNEWKIRKGQEAFQGVINTLKKGGNVLLYPSGHLKRNGKEVIGGASGAHEIIKECPDANIVLIRTTGLWGSSFSPAFEGRTPDLIPTLWHGIKTVLKNLIFFTPRRKITIEIEPNPQDFPRTHISRLDLNRYLENWYNRYPDEQGNIHESEPLQLVSYSLWHKEIPEPFKPQERIGNGTNNLKIPDEVRNKIYDEIRRILEKPDLEISPEQTLSTDLGMDSLNIAEFISFLVKHFDVDEIHPEDLDTVGNIFEVAVGEKKREANSRIPASQYTWPEEASRPSPMLPIGRTLPEAFLNSCQRMRDFSACGDDTVGVLNYKKMKRAVIVLAKYFKTIEEERVAVLLPASVGACIVILALQFAGKVPVMLNWTLGSRYLEEMMKITGSKKIITSWKFLERASNLQLGACIDQILLLEDIRKSLTLRMKLQGALLAKCSVQRILHSLGLNRIDDNAPCVVLFTSGTEAAPKGVPLSHKNIIANQRAAMQCIDFISQEVEYGILPPFHSFGFSVAGMFPLLGGIRIAFYPDPTDYYALAEGIQRWKVTLFCGAPSFIKGLFNAAKPEQLKTVRYFVAGAEKAPQELFDRTAELGNRAQLIEGYGITECAPVLTLNRPNIPPKGVGRLLPNIELITIHPETLEVLPKGADGEICVRGPNVFDGYLGDPRNPFIEMEGKKWYRTGDLGHLEEDGSLILSGRLKRFVKIGGEMISLGAIEQIIAQSLIRNKQTSPDVLSVAVSSLEKEGKTQIILFTIIDLDKDKANQFLLEAGFSNLVKISYVRKVNEIPLMGTGKTDYRKLQENETKNL